ncbi:hypothetical protein RJT34_29643 [Clitoria ternatea]|uniref:Uncharacterized protein ycf33 n=1 Tax=Clitoria ternatea TaxID=43366 RepID=A0AAN9EYI1_CLITE
MKNLSFSLRSEIHVPGSSSNPPLPVKPIKLGVVVSYRKNLRPPPSTLAIITRKHATAPSTTRKPRRRIVVVMGAVSVGILVLFLNDQRAWALGPEGPLVEEFWENVRRYGLYALTVSTGALYTVFRPIWELLKNPITAIFILALLGGSIYFLSQVLSAMVGVSDFTYDYGY